MEFLADMFFSWPGGLIEGGAVIWLARARVEKLKAWVIEWAKAKFSG